MFLNPLGAEEIAAMLSDAGIGPGQVAGTSMMPGGTFNSVYRVALTDGRRLVLKAAPPSEVPVLSHEHGLLRSEALLYRLAASREVGGVPGLVHEGDGFILMTELPGQPWHAVAAQLDDAQLAGLRADLGRLVAGLHMITGTSFGYPSGTLGPLAPTWKEAFGGMLAAVLADAERYEATLPRPIGEIRDLIAANVGVLDEVTTPVLVHYDLWAGNILVEPGDGPDGSGGLPRIGGIIDAERAFWGDPLADFVSLALFSDIRKEQAFLDGYQEAGGPVTLNGSADVRLALYRGYLYLIMLTEMTPRAYTPAERERLHNLATPALTAELGVLAG